MSINRDFDVNDAATVATHHSSACHKLHPISKFYDDKKGTYGKTCMKKKGALERDFDFREDYLWNSAMERSSKLLLFTLHLYPA